jgi:hypothetical protein
MASVKQPGGKATTILMGLAGHAAVWAWAGPDKAMLARPTARAVEADKKWRREGEV